MRVICNLGTFPNIVIGSIYHHVQPQAPQILEKTMLPSGNDLKTVRELEHGPLEIEIVAQLF